MHCRFNLKNCAVLEPSHVAFLRHGKSKANSKAYKLTSLVSFGMLCSELLSMCTQGAVPLQVLLQIFSIEVCEVVASRNSIGDTCIANGTNAITLVAVCCGSQVAPQFTALEETNDSNGSKGKQASHLHAICSGGGHVCN